MKLNDLTTVIFTAAALVAVGTLALSLTTGAAPAWAQSGKNGVIHVQKDCKDYDQTAGGHCTITASNLGEIPVSSHVYYDQAAGVPAGMLDSNVILDAGSGSRAVGHCTLDFATGLGLCTFSDGTGLLAGFSARVEVSYVSGTLWAWDGTYRFKPLVK
jgi:hypothetical protein